MAEYYSEEDVPELAEALSKYYSAGATAAIPQRDMHPEMAALLGIDPTRSLSRDELANILKGVRADGETIAGRAKQAKLSYVDFTFSAPKSVSLAVAFAETNAERAIVDDCHRVAVDKTMRLITEELGWMRRGNAGRLGADKGHMTWIEVNHFTSRPTAKIAVREGEIEDTVLVTVHGLGAGDPQRHTHCLLPTVILTEDGAVGSPDLNRLKESVHEWGAIYQAVLATELRKAGVRASLDPETGMAYLPDVPKWICKAFSKRSWESDDAARAYASEQGIAWDELTSGAKIAILKGQAKHNRKSKEEERSDWASWRKQAADLRYEHKRQLYPERGHGVPEADARVGMATEAALPMLAEQFVRRAKLEGSVPRIAAARGLIASGTEDPEKDIARVTASMRETGVIHEGRRTDILWAAEEGKKWASVTTALHADQENETIGLLQAAAADRSSDLKPEAIQRAVDGFLARSPHICFETEHGKSQREMIDRLATSGRAALGTGFAGSGKTTLLSVLADAWHEDGRKTYGVTLAWRQTHDLTKAGVGRKRGKRLEPDTSRLEEAGIAKDAAFALTRFLRMAGSGKLELDRNTVVVVDEAATIGTRQLLQLARLRAKHDFQLVGLADDKQLASLEHGNTVRLFRKALGEDQVPEIASTVRQESERDQETAALFRAGNAEAALARKAEDGTLLIVPGNAADAIKAAVDLWEDRQRANAGDPDYRIGISVPTNDDVLAVGSEIRARRRSAGEIGPDLVVIPAQDGRGTSSYPLALAIGDHVRLFNRVHGPDGGVFGDNGTVAELVDMSEAGPTLRRPGRNDVTVKWDKLRDLETGRIRMTYGDALTINTRQGDDMPEHIMLMPNGSQAVNGFAAYSADTRHRKKSWIVTSHGAEKQEVVGRRPLGDPRPIEPPDIQANIARNLSRQPEKVLATDFLEQAERERRESVRRQQEADFRQETAAEAPAAAPAATELQEERKRITGPKDAGAAATKPQKTQRKPRPTLSETDAVADFADALRRAGLIVKGPPVMDGKLHRVPVEGDKRGKRSGAYVGHSDGLPAGYAKNHKSGDEVRWKAAAVSETDPEARAAAAARIRAAREEADRQNAWRQEQAALRAIAIWNRSKPARADHPYLAKKGVGAHGLRQTERGELLVPMRDLDGNLRNVQTIHPDGRKLYLKAAQKSGMHMRLGEIEPGKPVVIGEGFATLATLRETTSLTAIVAFDSSGILPVAKAYRERYPDTPIIIAADNDHHLPRHAPPLPNVGLEKAKAAAAAVGGHVAAPQFDPSDPGTDWNDLAAKMGREAVRQDIATALREHGIEVPLRSLNTAQEGRLITQAERDAARAAAPAQTSSERARAAEQAAALRQSRGAAPSL